MPERIDNLRNSPGGDQGKSPDTARHLALAAVAALALAGCVNSNLLDPPVLFTKTAATTLPLECGGGKGELPTQLVMCGDVNTTTATPITLTIYSPFVPANGADSLAFALRVVNPRGDVVRTVAGKRATPGYITEVWDLRNDARQFVLSGDYRLYVTMSTQTLSGDVSVYR